MRILFLLIVLVEFGSKSSRFFRCCSKFYLLNDSYILIIITTGFIPVVVDAILTHFHPFAPISSHPKYRQALEKKFPKLVCGSTAEPDNASTATGACSVADEKSAA